MTVSTLLSIQVGQPQVYACGPEEPVGTPPWNTGFFKLPVTGPVSVRRTNLAGDGQADRKNHGGRDKAVLAYAASHYDLWRAELPATHFVFGGFGENLTIAGLTEYEVCIGDVWSLGTALLQVSQPRQPCWKLARRWQIKELATLVVANGRTGWYLRVLQEGEIEAGQPLALVERRHAAWTVSRAHRVMHHEKKQRDQAAELAALPELSRSWKNTLRRRLAPRRSRSGPG
jgi:MOSC domain-containing protein YiiM